MSNRILVQEVESSGSIQDKQIPFMAQANGQPVASAGVTAVEYAWGSLHTVILTLTNVAVTLVKATTVSGGGGTAIYNFPVGLIQPVGGTSDLTVANALDKSFLAGVGSAAADTGTTLTSTEISFLPQTASTTSSGVGTCRMKSTSTIPTPGGCLDGTSTAVVMYLNACLASDATGAEALTYSGTIQITYHNHGDN